MGYDTIHETSIQDIVNLLANGVNKVAGSDKFTRSGDDRIARSGSLTKATKGLIMEFPVLVSKANHIESAGIVAKAYEAKFVTMLQIAFSAFNITATKDGAEFIEKFHTNLDFGKITVDEFIDVMDGIAESVIMNADSYAQYKAVSEDMKNLSYYFDEDIKESSLNSYKVINHYGNIQVVKEMNNPIDDFIDDMEKSENKKINDDIRTTNDTVRTKAQLYRDKYQKDRDAKADKETERRAGIDANRDARDQSKFEREMITNNLVSSEVKKANELTPTMMVVNVKITQPNGDTINKQQIIGVKAKLYEVEPMDVINKLITKHVDNNFLLKLVKVSTREISFVKDFLLAIDDAKLGALSKSKRGSTNKLFKVLERRALGGKIRRTLKLTDYTKAISSLVISQEEAEELMKNNIDVSNPNIIRPIMEQLNLISFAIIDESSESVKFLFDTGDDVYETIPLTKLEREQKDGMSKKVINLMAKMNR